MRRVARAALALSFVVAFTSACSSSKSTLPPLSSVAVSTTTNTDTAPTGTGTLGTNPPSATTVPTHVISSTSTAASPTTAPVTSAASTPGTACTLDVIHAATGPAPAGITDIDLRCEGDWASWVGQANDPTASDGYFAVAKRTATGWQVVNFGTAGVCADGGVPQELWTALNCTE